MHTLRLTADDVHVYNHEKVWEILWCYLNAEVTRAEPSEIVVIEVPECVKMWKTFVACQKVCDSLNEPGKVDNDGNNFGNGKRK